MVLTYIPLRVNFPRFHSEMVKTVCYKTDPQDESRQSLDIYPSQSKRLLVFVHGGAWVSSSKSDFSKLGLHFQSKNIETVVIDYRITLDNNSVRYPDHLDDVMDALEYISKTWKNKEIVLMGHSCGVHLIGSALKEMNLGVYKIIYCEGIYSVADLSQRYPTYNKWFLDKVFKNIDKSEWESKLNVSLEPMNNYILLHSTEDELISLEHMEWFKSRMNCEYHQLKGTHDGVLETREFLDLVQSICTLE